SKAAAVFPADRRWRSCWPFVAASATRAGCRRSRCRRSSSGPRCTTIGAAAWPTPEDGAVNDAPGEPWKGIDLALHQGLRGLGGGSSLHALLIHHLGKGGLRTQHVKALATRRAAVACRR